MKKIRKVSLPSDVSRRYSTVVQEHLCTIDAVPLCICNVTIPQPQRLPTHSPTIVSVKPRLLWAFFSHSTAGTPSGSKEHIFPTCTAAADHTTFGSYFATVCEDGHLLVTILPPLTSGVSQLQQIVVFAGASSSSREGMIQASVFRAQDIFDHTLICLSCSTLGSRGYGPVLQSAAQGSVALLHCVL